MAVGSATGDSYGTTTRGRLAVDYSTRARSVVLSLLTATILVGTAWFKTQTPIVALQAHQQLNWTDFERGDSAEAFVDGEKSILDLFLKDSKEENSVVDKAYRAAQERVIDRLEAELERHFTIELQRAVAVKETQKTQSRIQLELDVAKNLIANQHSSSQGLNSLSEKIRALEREVCSGEPCEEAPAILSKERGVWQGKEAKLVNELAALNQESKDWRRKARKYFAILQAQKRPPSPRCAGLKEVQGEHGNITTGVSGGTETEDCRWIVRAPSAQSITLRFSDVDIHGSNSRVSVYVGPENVALYKNEDVVNWSSAFRSFTGNAFPLPLHCKSNEVLIIFHVEPKTEGSPEGSGFNMSWTTA